MENINEETVFWELDYIKTDYDELNKDYNRGYSRRLINGLDGVSNKEFKKTVQWLINEGYLIGSKVKIEQETIIFDYTGQSPITEKGMEYYKELSKKYDKEYWEERARKILSETKIGEGYENE